MMPPETTGARPDERDTDPRCTALQALAGLLRGQGYTADIDGGRLIVNARYGGRLVEVQAQHRDDDGGRLWSCWSGGLPMREAAHIADAAMDIRMALRRIPGP
jgi:hypothetical protein